MESISYRDAINSAITLLDYLNANNLTEHTISENHLPLSISCPLHIDRKPSFRLYRPADRGGYCFSCGKAYTAFSMHQALNNTSYEETIEYFMNEPAFQYANLSNLKDKAYKGISKAKKMDYRAIQTLSDTIQIITKEIKKRDDIANDFHILEKKIITAYEKGVPFTLRGNN